MMSSDFSLFVGQVLRRPHQVVALAPSSRHLCAEMAAEIDPAGGPVIELGAGTGTITQAILDRGVAPEDLHCIEINPDFCDRLSAQFPDINVHQMSAGDLGCLAVVGAQAVISGLPLLSMPLALQRDILRGAFQRLRPGGSYVQFTYGPKPPAARAVREELGLAWTVSDKIWWNMPPARVYRFTQSGAV
jgi:phosphatidylethanolamine/phosphatidyl-N-methylethanolamine N-methyltransferase